MPVCSSSELNQAVEVLRQGGLVAFATETVYGLGGDARNAQAIDRIFAAKGRPASNPLIVHVHAIDAARRWVSHWPDVAERLARQFWPGPLTLVLPKSPAIVDQVTAGLDSVGLRVPNHRLAIELLKAFDGPVAAPSANRSMRISPTTAEHVRAELGGAVDCILDGGPCEVGIESTVLDLSADQPHILRPGAVTAEMIEAVIGPLSRSLPTLANETFKSPGQMLIHYAPITPAFRIDRTRRSELTLADDIGVIDLGPSPQSAGSRITLMNEAACYARDFYAALRRLDAMGLRRIYVVCPPDGSEWTAIRDRIARATRSLPAAQSPHLTPPATASSSHSPPPPATPVPGRKSH